MPIIYIIVGLLVLPFVLLALALAGVTIYAAFYVLFGLLPIIVIVYLAYRIGKFIVKGRDPDPDEAAWVAKRLSSRLNAREQEIRDLVKEGMLSESDGQIRLRELEEERIRGLWEEEARKPIE